MNWMGIKLIKEHMKSAYPLICPKCSAAYAESEREAYNAHRQTCKAK